MKHSAYFLSVLWAASAAAYTPGKAGICDQIGDLDNLNPGEWCRGPASYLEDVKPNPVPPISGIRSLMQFWNGGAYDTKRERLIIWGGGHNNYAGNELYAFELNSMRWKRLNEPSVWDAAGREQEQTGLYVSDGRPRSVHTRNYIQYIPSIDRFCTLNSGDTYLLAEGGVKSVYCFDFRTDDDTGVWEKKADYGLYFAGAAGAITAIDPATGHVWYSPRGGSETLSKWIPSEEDGQWVHYVNENRNGAHTGAIGKNAFLYIGSGAARAWDLSSPNSRSHALTVSGERSILSADYPGLQFDPIEQTFVAWSGGPEVYTLDLDTTTWRLTCARRPLSLSNVENPGPAQVNGTYGRFRHVPSKNVYILVNSAMRPGPENPTPDIKGEVYFYKFAPDGGDLPPPSLPSRPRRLRVRQ